jgi:hypothetical protein
MIEDPASERILRSRARPKKLTDRTFLNAWSLVLSAGTRQGWKPQGVDWRRTRHSFTGVDHSFSVEVHSLRSSAARAPWALLVVVEHWWDSDGRPLKSATWAHRVSGSNQAIVAWCTAQASALSNAPPRMP